MHHYYGYSLEQKDKKIYDNLVKMHTKTPHALFYQFFITHPMHMGISRLSDKEISNIKKYCNKHHIKLVIHCSYMINIARKPVLNKKNKDIKISWWVKNLIDELQYASILGAVGCVLHLGKQTDLSTKEAIKNSIETLKYVLQYKPDNVKLILETSSGQGSEMFYILEDLAKFYKKIKKYKDIYFCVDTCHIFAAGYDLSQNDGFINYINKFDKLIGINNLGMIHLNDSKNILGSHIDRHESLGKGYIGKDNLEIIIKYCLKNHIPIMLETPKITHGEELQWISNLNNN